MTSQSIHENVIKTYYDRVGNAKMMPKNQTTVDVDVVVVVVVVVVAAAAVPAVDQQTDGVVFIISLCPTNN